MQFLLVILFILPHGNGNFFFSRFIDSNMLFTNLSQVLEQPFVLLSIGEWNII